MAALRRLAPPLLALAATALIAAPGRAAAPSQKPCGRAADGIDLATSEAVAQRIAANERSGAAVSRALRTIESDAVLAGAVAGGDAATLRSQVIDLLYNHEHIVRIRVLRNGAVLADIGGADVLAPVAGTLRLGGRVVGTFEFSLQDDLGYQKLAQRLVGADTVMTYQGRTVLANIDPGATPLPQRGTVTINHVRYLVATLDTGRFPSGTLEVSLLVAGASASLAQETCEQVRADVLGAIAERIYGEAIIGPGIAVARTAIAAASALPSAIDAGDLAAVRGSAPSLLLDAHVSRLQILVGARVVADVGTREPLVGPVPIAVTDAAGRDVATVLVSIQSVNGLYAVTSYLTQAFVLIRDGTHQLVGQRRGPAVLPQSGALSYDGAHFSVSSFAASLFPSGTLTVYLLVRD